ncbi:hypothetical protein PUNSTDRAFT_140878 [Punctularia strigosozonata HHB-11173 SS5]|uniref:uncharacterized protein n=1 Tax=Punctularia strigosozonata (strain HHB-11173) TaxID=741275 RepID=UPI0004416DFC|nr:uncharacterized protein PUNSTDRAFT_140878 [Punctularia strigosozonata HHB-11173 SS5]EIN14638.1 hypothetical protein PUNSTDRAFT_140878 [Punctularia strigosozonata HHB-11173 SS5]
MVRLPPAGLLQSAVLTAIADPSYTFSLPQVPEDMWRELSKDCARSHCRNPYCKHENDRLEFIGDSLVYTAIALELHRQYPNSPSGFYTIITQVLTTNLTFYHLLDKRQPHLARGPWYERALWRSIVPLEPHDLWSILPRGVNDRLKTGGDLFETVIGASFRSRTDVGDGFAGICAWTCRTFSPLIAVAARAFHDYDPNTAREYGGLKRSYSGSFCHPEKRPRMTYNSPVPAGSPSSIRSRPPIVSTPSKSALGVDPERPRSDSSQNSAKPVSLNPDIQARPIKKLPLHARLTTPVPQVLASGPLTVRLPLQPHPLRRFGNGSLRSEAFDFSRPPSTPTPPTRTSGVDPKGILSPLPLRTPARTINPLKEFESRLHASPAQVRLSKRLTEYCELAQDDDVVEIDPPLSGILASNASKKSSAPVEVIDLTLDDDEDNDGDTVTQIRLDETAGDSHASDQQDNSDDHTPDDLLTGRILEDMDLGSGDASVILSVPPSLETDSNADDVEDAVEVQDLLGVERMFNWLQDIGAPVTKISFPGAGENGVLNSGIFNRAKALASTLIAPLTSRAPVKFTATPSASLEDIGLLSTVKSAERVPAVPPAAFALSPDKAPLAMTKKSGTKPPWKSSVPLRDALNAHVDVQTITGKQPQITAEKRSHESTHDDSTRLRSKASSSRLPGPDKRRSPPWNPSPRRSRTLSSRTERENVGDDRHERAPHLDKERSYGSRFFASWLGTEDRSWRPSDDRPTKRRR